MAEKRVGIYEATFLVGQAAAADLASVVEHVRSILDRAGAEVLAMRKWDERRLAYEIEKQKRGVFLLTYFKAPTGSITGLERDCNLSETIMRVMVLRADHLTDEEIAAADARQALEDEARMRSEETRRQADAPEARVSAGAPEQEKAEQPPEGEQAAEGEKGAEAQAAEQSS